MSEGRVEEALETLSELADSIHAFFDAVMVMAEDEKVRNNRLGLLKQISEDIYQYADLTQIEWKQQF